MKKSLSIFKLYNACINCLRKVTPILQASPTDMKISRLSTRIKVLYQIQIISQTVEVTDTANDVDDTNFEQTLDLRGQESILMASFYHFTGSLL